MDLNDNIATFLAKMEIVPEKIDGSLSFIESLVLKSMRCPFYKTQNNSLEFEDFILDKIEKLLFGQSSDIQFLTSLEQEIVESIDKMERLTGNSRKDRDCFYLQSVSPNIPKYYAMSQILEIFGS